jgi:uncharacterized membrane protein
MELTAFQKHKLDRLYKDSFKKLEDAVIKLEESKKLIQTKQSYTWSTVILLKKVKLRLNQPS